MRSLLSVCVSLFVFMLFCLTNICSGYIRVCGNINVNKYIYWGWNLLSYGVNHHHHQQHRHALIWKIWLKFVFIIIGSPVKFLLWLRYSVEPCVSIVWHKGFLWVHGTFNVVMACHATLHVFDILLKVSYANEWNSDLY